MRVEGKPELSRRDVDRQHVKRNATNHVGQLM